MMKKIKTRLEDIQDWYNNEIEKDKLDLETEKKQFIEEIKKINACLPRSQAAK